MSVQHITDLKTPIGDVLRVAGADGVLLESPEKRRYAVIPLDDDLIDFLLEHNPRFLESCEQIRQSMQAGQFKTHDQVRQLLAEEE